MEREAAALGSDGAELRAAALALLDSTGPEAEEQEWRGEETERSGGATGELLTERPVMPRWLTRMETGSGLGQEGRERERGRRCARRGEGLVGGPRA